MGIASDVVRRASSVVASVCALVLALVVVVDLTAPPADASARDCTSTGYACTPGYTGNNASTTWAWRYYGPPYSNTPNGTHNCTLFAAFMLAKNGMPDPGRSWGNASEWASSIGGGDHTPAVGSIAWWGGGYGHVAYVEAVDGANVLIRADNWSSTAGNTSAGWIKASDVPLFLHPHDIGGGSTPPQAAPAPVSGLVVQDYASKVELSWAPSDRATDYIVSRNGAQLDVVQSPSFVDRTTVPYQRYRYSVVARNSTGTSTPSTRSTLTGYSAGPNRAYVPSTGGLSECGRAGGPNDQRLVCNVLGGRSWTRRVLPKPGDWGYGDNRSWIPNRDGTVSYCSSVGTGNQVRCDTLRNGAWITTTSPPTDLGYNGDREFLPTRWGPSICGRAGGEADQRLVCNILRDGVWTSTVLPRRGDWGYGDNQAWVPNRDGTVSYCATVGVGDQVRCDTYNGSAWKSRISSPTDLGYNGDRAYVPSVWGPAICGRAGGQDDQRLVCNILRDGKWMKTVLPRRGDWGYPDDRAWLPNRDGTISYCSTVGTGNQLRCDTYTGKRWVTRISQPTDLGYHGDRTYLPSAWGPAECGRAGSNDDQRLVCNILRNGAWTKTVLPRRGDWGYGQDRSWLVARTGNIARCGAVGTGNQVRCDTYNGKKWTTSISDPTDLGYG